MSTEITDTEGLAAAENAGRGLVVWDDECDVCNRMKRWVASRVAVRGYAFCPLRIWRAAHPDASAEGMWVVTPAGDRLFAVDAALHVARLVPWLKPFAWIGRLPLMHGIASVCYRWFAAHRYSLGCNAGGGGHSSCKLNSTKNPD